MNMDFIFDLLILAFSDMVMQMFAIHCFVIFVFGSYSNIHVSSPLNIFLKIFLSLGIRSRRWRYRSFRMSFFSFASFLATICPENFLMANSCLNFWWDMNSLKCNSLAIIRTVSRRSDRTRDCTFSTLLSVFEFEILPECDSILWIHGPPKIPYTTWTLVTSTNHSPHRPVSVSWKFQCRFPQGWHKTWLQIFPRNCDLPFLLHTKKSFTENRIKNSVLTIAIWNS